MTIDEEKMSDLDQYSYFQPAEDLTKYLKEKTQSTSISFFRTVVDYNLCKLASLMRVKVVTHDRGVIPVNMYAIALAPSGTGKGHSTNIIEDQIVKGFRERYLSEVLPEVAKTNLAKIAVAKAHKKGTDPDDELPIVEAEYERTGTFVFNFDSGTTPAIKQMRHKLLMCGAGSINMEIDEIGSNLLSNQEVLTAFLELFDVGKIKQKLTKNTNENIRGEDIEGKTPTNLLLYGTPAKLLNGGKIEEEYLSFIETGYGRRCFFSYTSQADKKRVLTAEEAYLAATNQQSMAGMLTLASQIEQLADITHFGAELIMDKDVAIELIKYRMRCETLAEEFSEHQEMQKAELSHRYFKAVKLAGAYAFVDGSYQVNKDHLMAAIKRAEDSGKDFERILTRDRNYVKLAKYIADIGHEVTNVDLVEDLPFYRGSASQKSDMMNLGIAWAYKNHIIVKRSFVDGIEFYKGERLELTNLNKLILSHSDDWVKHFKDELAPFNQLDKLFNMANHNWVNHRLLEGYREEDKVISGFNLIALDVDGTATLEEAKTYLADYLYYLYTTKRHGTDPTEKDRFRIVMPISHKLFLDREEYRNFMQNIADWLPIPVDEQTFQRARKWLTHNGEIHKNLEGAPLDALLFIPKTNKSDQLRSKLAKMDNLNNLERWFVSKTGEGNRSNQLVKFALMLVDAGKSYDEIEHAVKQLNEKLPNGLNEAELMSTILATTTKAILKREKS